MTIRELEALVVEYERKATKFGQCAGVVCADVEVYFTTHHRPAWAAWIVGSCADGGLVSAPVSTRHHAPAAALRAAYRAYCKEVRKDGE